MFKAFKVVGGLPATLEADAIYAVRVGVGFDLYITDSTGVNAHKVNAPEGARIHVGITPPTDTTMLWVQTT